MQYVACTLCILLLTLKLYWNELNENAIVCIELLSDSNWKDSFWTYWVHSEWDGEEKRRDMGWGSNHDWKTGIWMNEMSI